MPGTIDIRYYPAVVGGYDPVEYRRLEAAAIAAAKVFGIEAMSASVGLIDGSHCQPHYLILVHEPDNTDDGQMV